MSWKITGESVAADPYYNNVSLLLHGDGTNGSTTIVDSSPSPKTVTVFGDAQISTAQSKFGGASIAFDGTGDYLTLAPNTAFGYGVGDFTWEAWVYCNTISGIEYFMDHTGGNAGIIQRINDRFAYFNTTIGSGGPLYVTGSGSISADTWYHIAVCRANGTTRLFLDGVEKSSQADSHNYPTAGIGLGSYFLRDEYTLNGYMDEFRITKGIARYTSNFTPPTAPFPEVLG